MKLTIKEYFQRGTHYPFSFSYHKFTLFKRKNSWFFLNICEQNVIFYILTKFHDDVIDTKIMAILSTRTSGFSNVFQRNL